MTHVYLAFLAPFLVPVLFYLFMGRKAFKGFRVSTMFGPDLVDHRKRN